MKILVIEDERRIARAIREGLEQESYAVDLAFDGEEGYRFAGADEYDAIIMDLMLPVMDGNEVCRRLRADGNNTPILMVTARDTDKDIIKGLDSGADDYLPKPFSFSVLLARLRALLRRPHDTLEQVLQYDDLILDPSTITVTRAGKNIKLSGKEFSILHYMMRRPEHVFTKNNIMTHVWNFDADVSLNNLEVFINYLRNKIDKPFDKPLIRTVHGFGYKISNK